MSKATQFTMVDRIDVCAEFEWDLHDLAGEILRLRADLGKVQSDLDQEVGYKIAAAAIPRGEWDREDVW